ncbi:MAG: DNA replication and repair protein RecF [Candidatus Enteromonas sp.]|nr:DNA replication and repair protein RecF [Candidatus Enteromonas sp.]
MILTRLRLKDFRCYSDLDLCFEPGVNAILGPNGSGKTNIAEAIQFLSFARSFRTAEEAPLIKEGRKVAVIEASLKEGALSRTIRIELSKEGKRVLANGKPLRKFSELTHLVNVVLFSPSDVTLFTGSPADRRSFLNASLSKQSVDYFRLISRYSALLKERNALLKAPKVENELLDILTKQMLEVQEPIVRYRAFYVASLNKVLPELLRRLRGEEVEAALVYRPFLPLEDFFLRGKELYDSTREGDILHRSTSAGVHREDFSLRLSGKDISLYGSQGENRLAALALKLSPYYLIEDESKKPMVVLDDVTSELDEGRTANLISLLRDFAQTFLTTTDIHIPGATYFDVANDTAIRRNYNGR